MKTIITNTPVIFTVNEAYAERKKKRDMKKQSKLKHDLKGVNCDVTCAAFNSLIAMKYKPAVIPNKGGWLVRVHIKKGYFDYAAKSGKWVPTKRIGTGSKWNESESVENFIGKVLRSLGRQVPATARQITYLASLYKKANEPFKQEARDCIKMAWDEIDRLKDIKISVEKETIKEASNVFELTVKKVKETSFEKMESDIEASEQTLKQLTDKCFIKTFSAEYSTTGVHIQEVVAASLSAIDGSYSVNFYRRSGGSDYFYFEVGFTETTAELAMESYIDHMSFFDSYEVLGLFG